MFCLNILCFLDNILLLVWFQWYFFFLSEFFMNVLSSFFEQILPSDYNSLGIINFSKTGAG